MKRILSLAGITLVLASPASAATRSHLIRTSASFQRLGDFWITRDPTYDGALRALGPSSSCRLAPAGVLQPTPDHVVARWDGLGVTIDLRTYGGLPRGKTGCSAPPKIHVSFVRVTGHEWHTAYGLRVGDSVAKLRRRYPHATRRRSQYILVSRFGCNVADCPPHPGVPVLVAETHRGVVSALVLPVFAEGD